MKARRPHHYRTPPDQPGDLYSDMGHRWPRQPDYVLERAGDRRCPLCHGPLWYQPIWENGRRLGPPTEGSCCFWCVVLYLATIAVLRHGDISESAMRSPYKPENPYGTPEALEAMRRLVRESA